MEKSNNKNIFIMPAYLFGQIALLLLIIIVIWKLHDIRLVVINLGIAIISVILACISVIYKHKKNIETRRLSIILVLINIIICGFIIHYFAFTPAQHVPTEKADNTDITRII